MGASLNSIRQSDGYLVNILDGENPRLSKKKEVAWLDFNLKQEANQRNKEYFETQFQHFQAFSSLQQLISYQNTLLKSQTTLLMICAASLNKDCFEFIQKSEKVEQIILFCMNIKRANSLKQEYSKINHICLSPADVVREVKLWKSSQEKQFVLFSQKNVEFINKFNSSLFSLTERQFLDSQQAQQDLKQYLRAIPSTQKKYIQLFKQILDIKQKKIKITQKIVNIANQLLILTTNSNVLGHIRLLVSLLFNSIKEKYKILKKMESNVGFYMLKLKENEKSLVKPENVGKFMMITKFIRAEYKQQLQPTIDEIQLKIILNKNPEKDCNGFHSFQQNLIINPGNYFKIVNYDKSQSVLEVILYQFDPLPSFQNVYGQTEENKIALNRLFIFQQGQKYKGQSLSLILHNQTIFAEKSLLSKMEKCQKVVGKQIQYGSFLLGLFCLKCKNKNSQDQLEKLLSKSNQSIVSVMKIEFLQFLWKFSSKQMLKKLYITHNPKKDILKPPKKLKLQLLEAVILSNLSKIQRIEQNSSIQQRNPQNMILILKIKLAYYEQFHKNKMKQQIKLIEQLIKMFRLCYGCTYFELDLLRNKKKLLAEVYQWQNKKKKYTSSISLKALHQNEKNKPNEAYNISLKSIKSSIFE